MTRRSFGLAAPGILIAGLLLAASAAALSGPAGPRDGATTDPGFTVLQGATLIDGTGAPPRPDSIVVLQGDRIVKVGKQGEVPPPEGAAVMDLAGKYLLPGLIDMHAHVAILPPGEGGRLRRHDNRPMSERVLKILLAMGITTVRNPAAPADDGVALREAVASGRILGPRIFTAGESLNRPFPGLDGPAVGVATEKEVRREVARQAEIGVDYIKVYASLPPDLVRAAIEEAHARGLKVIGHLQRTTWTEAARFGIDFITHGASWSAGELPAARREEYGKIRGSRERIAWLEWVDPGGPEITEMIAEMVKRRIPVDPTLVAYQTKFWQDEPLYTKSPDLALVPPLILKSWQGPGFTAGWGPEEFGRARAAWPKVLQLVKLYHDRGVVLLTGSDLSNPWIVPGAGLHRELELLVEAGLPPLEVLTMATRNGAAALGILDTAGTVEAGKRSDVVVLAASPLEDIRNTRKIATVYRAGVAYEPAALLKELGLSSPSAEEP